MAKLNLIELCPTEGQKRMSGFYGVSNLALKYIKGLQDLNGGFGITLIREDYYCEETPSETIINYLNENVFTEKTKEVLGNGGICKITNDKFSWVLQVDGKTIPFNGSDNADYFADLYTKLGYNIEWDKDKWQEDITESHQPFKG